MTSSFNVEASLNAWLIAEVATASKPGWLAVVTVVVNHEEVTASLPCLSVTHIPVSARDAYQGRIVSATQVGRAMTALMEINAWVSRDDYGWQAQLRTMQRIVEQAATQDVGVLILDYESNTASPAATGYRVLLDDLQILTAPPDPNPNIERRRMQITYRWTLRV